MSFEKTTSVFNYEDRKIIQNDQKISLLQILCCAGIQPDEGLTANHQGLEDLDGLDVTANSSFCWHPAG